MVRRTLILIAFLWVLAIGILLYLYFSGRFVLFLDTMTGDSAAKAGSFVLTSTAFTDGASIPTMYTCDLPAQAGAKQISPPLSIGGVPDGTKSLVLIAEDRDVPKKLQPNGVFLHWLVYDIPADTRDIETGEIPGVLGASGNGVAGYIGLCPPTEYEPTEHRYYFDVYAIDTVLGLPEGSDISTILGAIDGHVIARATLTGRYERQK